MSGRTRRAPAAAAVSAAQSRRRIAVRGVVQGVGFRPYIHRRAAALGLTGWVANSLDGVTVEVEGSLDRIAELVEAIRHSPPANATIEAVEMRDVPPQGDTGFGIRSSANAGTSDTQVLPDLATCDACLAELLDPTNRRYRYPFTSCTQCGPRYSVLEDLPFDRGQTSMKGFAMCPLCQAEFDDPADRRFHSQLNACPACGPRLALWNVEGVALVHENDALIAAVAAIRDGRIVALKGIGGFHLIADARNEATVRMLRARKRRPDKPFAVMFPGIDAVGANCHLDARSRAVLCGPARPIVLLPRAAGSVAPSVAPDSALLGAFLPYAPIHHLLLGELGFPVVATSGNVSDEPIVTDDEEAVRLLGGIADMFLVHDRPIVRPVDDSVMQFVMGEPQVLRRARGLAPIRLPSRHTVDGVLAYGAHLKATVALGGRSGVVVSQHLGDLGTTAARESHRRAIEDICRLQGGEPRIAVRDLHPDYASSRAAEVSGLPVVAVQHHVAHVAACLAENRLEPPALGVAWDGTGYGPDGTIWGGEFMHVTDAGWRRVGHLRPFRLPGGEAAIREPRRAAVGLLHAAFGERAFAMSDLPSIAAFGESERAVLRTMLDRGVNAPLTSSAGRLFDAFASLFGLRQQATYEGQAAMELEARAHIDADAAAYRFPVCAAGDGSFIVDWQPAVDAAVAGCRAGVDIRSASAAFHAGLADAIVAMARLAGERCVALTGGCFQNVRLAEAAIVALRDAGFEPVWHRLIPPNDGGIAVGQAVWAARMAAARDEGATPCA